MNGKKHIFFGGGGGFIEHNTHVLISLQLLSLRSQRTAAYVCVPFHIFNLRMDTEKVSATHCLVEKFQKSGNPRMYGQSWKDKF